MEIHTCVSIKSLVYIKKPLHDLFEMNIIKTTHIPSIWIYMSDFITLMNKLCVSVKRANRTNSTFGFCRHTGNP